MNIFKVIWYTITARKQCEKGRKQFEIVTGLTGFFFHNNKLDHTIYKNNYFNNSQCSHKNLQFLLYTSLCFLIFFAIFSTMLSLTATYFLYNLSGKHLVIYWLGAIRRYLFGSKIPFTEFQPKFNDKYTEFLWWSNDCSRVRQKLTKYWDPKMCPC